MKPIAEPPAQRSRRPGAWGRCLSVVLASGLVAIAGAWVASPLGWRVDLLANLSAHAAPIPVVAGVWWALRRRWTACALAGAAIALHTAALFPGRAPRSADPPSIRVLVYNPNHDNAARPAAIDMVRDCGADVAALVETPLGMVIATREGGRLREAYPYVAHRGSGPGRDTSHHALLSRWPLTRIDGVPLDDGFDGVIEVVVESPKGHFGVVVAHPHSPRTAERWARGLDEARRIADAARRLADHGLPVVILGDLNSTPSGLVSRRIRAAAGVRRCKPLLVRDGTFPAQYAWPRRVAIDDALVSAGVAVTGWRVLDAAGSDHAPVLIGLRLPAP